MIQKPHEIKQVSRKKWGVWTAYVYIKVMCTQIQVVWYILILDTITCKQTHMCISIKMFMCTQNIIQPISLFIRVWTLSSRFSYKTLSVRVHKNVTMNEW